MGRAACTGNVSCVLADPGYDSEGNHEYAESVGISSLIRPRFESLPVYRTRGCHRKQMKRKFDWEGYCQRNKVETVFSVIKGVMGGDVMSRGILTQNREVMYRVIVYNCYRITRNSLLIVDGFYRADSNRHLENDDCL